MTPKGEHKRAFAEAKDSFVKSMWNQASTKVDRWQTFLESFCYWVTVTNADAAALLAFASTTSVPTYLI